MEIAKIERKEAEFKTVEDLIADCDHAVVTYGMDKNGKIHKAVTLFTRSSDWIYEFEEYGAAHDKAMGTNPDMALAKTWDYKILGKMTTRIVREYSVVLFRNLIGFVKDKYTHDLRDIYEKMYSYGRHKN